MKRLLQVPALCAIMMVLALGVASPATAGTGTVPRILALLDRDVIAARAHVAALREQLALEPLVGPTQGAADIAGIADGGTRSTLAALQLVGRGMDRRLDELRSSLPGYRPEHTELLLIMRTALGAVQWTIQDLPLATDVASATGPSRQALLDRLERSLDDLSQATAALVELPG